MADKDQRDGLGVNEPLEAAEAQGLADPLEVAGQAGPDGDAVAPATGPVAADDGAATPDDGAAAPEGRAARPEGQAVTVGVAAPSPRGRLPGQPTAATWVGRGLIVLAVVFVYVWSVQGVGLSLSDLLSGSAWAKIGRFARQMWPIDWSYLPSIQRPLFATLRMAVAGTTFGAIVAVPFALLAARNTAPFAWVYSVTKIFLNLVRTIPDLIYATILVAAVGIGALPGVLAIAVLSFTIITKLLAESIETIDPGPQEAMKAVGARRLQEVGYAVVPQVLPQFVAYVLYTFEITVRASVVVGLVGAGGIGVTLNNVMNFYQFGRAAAIIFTILVVVMLIDYISTKLRERLV